MPTSAPAHAAVTDRQGRLTIVMIDDHTVVTNSTGTTTPFTQVSRLQSSDAQNDTKVTEVIEIGTNGIVGGIVDLGEFKGKLSAYDTGNCVLIGLLTGKKLASSPGSTQSWNYYDLANIDTDYCRLIADPTGAIYAAWLALDAICSDANWDTKVGGNATEEFGTMGPQLVYVNGFPISKVYNIASGDVTNQYINVSALYGGNEVPLPVLPPASGQPPNSLYSSGRALFMKIVRVPSATATIAGQTYAAGTLVRYRENQPYQCVDASAGTIGAQTVTPRYIDENGTYHTYVGPELTVGASIIVDIGGANQEVCVLTGVTSSTISFTTTKTHSTSSLWLGLNPASGQCIYNPITGNLVAGDTLVLTDVWRFIFMSWGTNSMPTTIGTTSFDTTSVPGIPGRLTPVNIAAYQIPRAQSASVKVSVGRKHVNGCGENEIIYGTAAVPAITYSVDVMASDNGLIEALSSGGTTGNGTGGDIYTLDHITRYMNTNANNFVISLKSPVANSFVLKTITGGHPVFESVGETGSSNSEMTYKLSGKDIAGTITIAGTHP